MYFGLELRSYWLLTILSFFIDNRTMCQRFLTTSVQMWLWMEAPLTLGYGILLVI